MIQYCYERYGAEHTGMVCNLVTYRARSAVREVGYALGFPRPLVDRVAKALETYDSVMVRRDLEAEGGFAEFFASAEGAGAGGAAGIVGGSAAGGIARADLEAVQRGLLDGMGQLNDGRGVVPLAPVEAIRPGRRGSSDDEGGPGDTPVSVRWLRAGGAAAEREVHPALQRPPRPIDPADPSDAREPALRPGVSLGVIPGGLSERQDGFELPRDPLYDRPPRSAELDPWAGHPGFGTPW